MSRMEAVSQLYVVASRATVTRETVAVPEAAALQRDSFRLRRAAMSAECFEDEPIATIFRQVRRALWVVNTTPLAPSDTKLRLNEAVEFVEFVWGGSGASYSGIAREAERCVRSMRALVEVSANPLGDLVSDVARLGDPLQTGLVTKSPCRRDVDAWLATELPGVVQIPPSGVLAVDLETLVVVGASAWYPAHLTSAPRAETLCFVHLSHIRDTVEDPRLFSGSRGFTAGNACFARAARCRGRRRLRRCGAGSDDRLATNGCGCTDRSPCG